MGSTMFLLGRLAAPVRKLCEGVGRARTQARLSRAGALASAGNPIHRMAAAPVVLAPIHAQQHHRRARVLRVLDKGMQGRGGGRLVVSGRLADVCAELDRLAALEAAAA